ncbi:type II toxin-antitoxin system VapC family toxin [Runella sp. SP2]|uniref:type II toxin-antitoxin system VapC family toxin n=1 Tax=Runella sp. SP2 TaxID=2268026 RepID=UPI000F0881C2|nr:type II toxin-antitoxin system VapC family toxin [Runella sp. SP2]AYQ33788.1 type II toxin-antitoxin system VapC family toxin [Runella sp. SP2]
MKYLIDSCTFLWFNEGSNKISPLAHQLIRDPNNEIYISIASLWEISIKTSLHKLEIAGGYNTVIEDIITNNMDILSINFSHTLIQNKLPFYHRDPFDRMIVSQAIAENMNLISSDVIFDSYLATSPVKRIW